jgi:hypothetical protein
MYKTTMTLAVILIAAAGTLAYTGFPVQEVLNAIESDRTTQAKERAYLSFKQVHNDSLDALANGRITMREAHARIGAAANRDYPEFFEALSTSEQGSTDHERLANYLAGHIRGDADSKANASNTSSLDAELLALLGELKSKSN